MNIKDMLSRLERALGECAPDLASRLQPGADLALVERIQRDLGAQLPSDLVEAYLWHNGCRSTPDTRALGMFGHYQWYPLETLPGRLVDFADDELDDQYVFGESDIRWNELRVRPWNFRPRSWVPIGDTVGSSNILFVDLQPGPRGRFGQLVSEGIDSMSRSIFADGILEYMEELVCGLESRKVFAAIHDVNVGDVAWCTADGQRFRASGAERVF